MPDTLSISYVAGYTFTPGELVTTDKLNLLGQPSIALDGTIGAATISDGAVTTAKLADGALSADATGRAKMADAFLTAAKLNATQDWTGKTLSGTPTVTWSGAISFASATFTPPAGMLVQQVHASTTTATAITATIPLDDTIPQNTEGTQILTGSITPKSATNILEIEALVDVGFSSGGAVGVLALFQDATAAALAAAHVCIDGVGAGTQILLRYRMVAGTTSAITFNIRAGTTSGTMTLNANGTSRVFGGIGASRLFIKEITA